jgi:ribonuclease T2
MLRRLSRFRVSLIGIVIGALVVVLPSVSSAQYRNQDRPHERGLNEPGRFDFYVLALSWSPSYCDVSRERGRGDPTQCGERPYAFVVHGLWPQHERGFPAFCQVPAPRLPRAIVNTMLDLMPSPRLVFHEWDRHGTCSGLSAQAFFDNVRKARALVKIPAEYQAIESPRTVSPAEVEDAFIKANPGLSRAGMAVACDGRRLNEVRICLNKDFGFRDCAEISRRSCRSASLVMPPVRGAKQAGDARANNGQASDTPVNGR